MRKVHGICGVLSLAVVLVVAGCGGGGAASTTSGSAADPAGWKRCGNTYHGFSIAYPGNWHVASYKRLHVLTKGDAYRRQFFRHNVCLNYDPRPFTVSDGTEGPTTAVTVFRLTAHQFPRTLREWFQPRYVRVLQHRTVVVGGHPAIRYHVYLRRGAPLWDRSHTYGYLINFGRKGGLVVETWRYGFKPIPWQQYRSHMTLLDRMAPTARIENRS